MAAPKFPHRKPFILSLLESAKEAAERAAKEGLTQVKLDLRRDADEITKQAGDTLKQEAAEVASRVKLPPGVERAAAEIGLKRTLARFKESLGQNWPVAAVIVVAVVFLVIRAKRIT